MDVLDRIEWQIFIWVNWKRKCPGWIGRSFVDESIPWAHWVFSCQEDCPMRRKEKRRTASFRRFKKRNEKKNNS